MSDHGGGDAGGSTVVRKLVATLGVKPDTASFKEAETAIEGVKSQLAGLSKLGGLSEMSGHIGHLAHQFKDLMKGPGALIAGAGAMGVGLLGLGKRAADTALKMNALSQKVGMDFTSFQEIAFAAKESFVEVDELVGAFRKFSSATVESQKAGSESAKTFDKLGVKTKDASGKIRPANDLLLDMADKFKVMPQGMEKTHLAVELFGRSGMNMIPMLNKGSAGLKEYIHHAHTYGIVLDENALKNAKAFSAAKKTIHAMWEGIETTIGAAMLPFLAEGMTKLKGFFENTFGMISGGVKHFVSEVTAAMNMALVAIWPVTTAVEALGGVIKGLDTVMGQGASNAFFKGLTSILSPITNAWNTIQDIGYYLQGKGSALGLSMAQARGKGAEYIAGIESGGKADLFGGIVNDSKKPMAGGGIKSVKGSAAAFGDTAENAFRNHTTAGALAQEANAANLRGDMMGQIVASLAFIPAALFALPEAAIRTKWAGSSVQADPTYDYKPGVSSAAPAPITSNVNVTVNASGDADSAAIAAKVEAANQTVLRALQAARGG